MVRTSDSQSQETSFEFWTNDCFPDKLSWNCNKHITHFLYEQSATVFLLSNTECSRHVMSTPYRTCYVYAITNITYRSDQIIAMVQNDNNEHNSSAAGEPNSIHSHCFMHQQLMCLKEFRRVCFLSVRTHHHRHPSLFIYWATCCGEFHMWGPVT